MLPQRGLVALFGDGAHGVEQGARGHRVGPTKVDHQVYPYKRPKKLGHAGSRWRPS